MTITFADPGYDWTALMWTGGVLAVWIIGVLLAATINKFAYPKQWDGFWFEWPGICMGIAAAWLVIGVGLGGGITGSTVYDDRVDGARMVALYDAGFNGIEWVYSSDDEADYAFIASLDDKYFKGSLIPDPNAEPGTFEYRIQEWKVTE